jgi:hypothetical protein
MPNIPSNVSYGTVTGRFIVAYGDTADSGLEPDAVPAQGSVFFTPSPILLKNQTASPSPVTILPATVGVSLDEDGYLRSFAGEAGLGVRLVATDDEDNNPVNWTWSVEFRLTDEAGTPVALPSFSFSLPSNSSVDLTDLSPVPSANGTFYLVGPVGPPNVLTVGTVTTGAPTTAASVTITGESPEQVINFTIPKGDTGSLESLDAESPITYSSNVIGFDWSATEIDDLGDVSLASPNDSDMIKWNSSSSLWEKSNIIDGGTA